MGKGLIPADLETWKPRRRAIVPAFHRAWLGAMVAMFNACTRETARKLDSAVAAAGDAVRPRGVPRTWHSNWGRGVMSCGLALLLSMTAVGRFAMNSF